MLAEMVEVFVEIMNSPLTENDDALAEAKDPPELPLGPGPLK
jgi:hypothetical protein